MANDYDPRVYPLNTGNKGTVPGHYYQIDTATDVYVGQPVYLGSDGVLELSKTGSAGFQQVLGICLGFAVGNSGGTARGSDIQTPSTSGNPWLDVSALPGAGKTAYAFVADDPTQEYVGQADTGGASTFPQANFGAISRLTFDTTSTGNTTTGNANIEVDRSVALQTSGASVAVIALRPHDNVNTDGTRNDLDTQWTKVVFQLANHQKLQSYAAVQGI